MRSPILAAVIEPLHQLFKLTPRYTDRYEKNRVPPPNLPSTYWSHLAKRIRVILDGTHCWRLPDRRHWGLPWSIWRTTH